MLQLVQFEGQPDDLDSHPSTAVFTSVSKGVVANEKDLKEAFGTTDEKSICLEILLRGDLQVSDKERKQEYDNLFKVKAHEGCLAP